MLHVPRQAHPGVHALLVHRDAGCGEGRIREGAHRDGHVLCIAFHGVVDRRAAMRAEVEGGSAPFVADADELLCASADSDRTGWKPRLHSKRAAAPTLARKTVTDRNADRLG